MNTAKSPAKAKKANRKLNKGGKNRMVSAKRILADLKVFGRGYMRNKIGLFFGIVFPVILIVLFGAIFSNSSSASVTVYVQNQDNGPLGGQFVTALNQTGTLKIEIVGNSDNFTLYLADHSSSDGIVIPENFSASYATNTTVNLIVYGNPTSSTSGIVTGTVMGVANGFNLRGMPQTIGITSATVNTEQTQYIDFLIPGLIGFSILISPMFAMVNISAEYKKAKLFKQLSLTPITKMEWLISKILWYFILSCISFAVLVAVGIFGFGAHITLTLWLIPFLFLGPMMFCSLGMLVGTLSKSVETASVIGNVITFPMMFLSGTFFPLSIMPEYLRTFAHVLPLYYVVEGLNNVMVYAPTTGNYAPALIDIGVIAVLAIIIFVAAAKLFKWRED
jgi:ABC-2 type transport system permease protein